MGGGGGNRSTEGRGGGGGKGQLPRPPEPDPLTAQQLHTQGDAVVPGHGQDAHEASQEGRLKHVLLVGVVVLVAWEDLGAGRASGGPPSSPPTQSPRPHGQGTPGVARGGQQTLTLLSSAPSSLYSVQVMPSSL